MSRQRSTSGRVSRSTAPSTAPPSSERAARTIVPPSSPPGSGESGGLRPAVRSVPRRLVVGTDALGLDHLTAFVLLHVDGVSTVGQIVHVSGISHVEVVAMLEELCGRGVVSFEDAAPGSISEVRVIASMLRTRT